MDRLDLLEGKSVFVTGASGFIGAHLVQRLSRAGAEISVLMRSGNGRDDLRGKPALPEGVRTFEGDLTRPSSLKKAFSAAGPLWVFHLAALTDVRRDPELEKACRRINLEGTLNLAEALLGSGMKRLIHCGTCEEYGTNEAPFSEDMSVRPVSPYSASKAKASLALQRLWREEGFPVVILRPFLTYGPGQKADRFIAQAIRSALEDKPLAMTPGEQTREFNHVEDIARGFCQAATAPDIEGEIINLACGDERKIGDVARLIYKLCGARSTVELGALPYRSGEAMRFFGSTEKCRRLLGYEPVKRLEDGLKELVDWERTKRKEENHGHSR
ncbi:MAG: NAD-dependent epimerase/dehydratase family protein [Planctomycetota bacterium]|jgi:nucleoside-diphosphate-sugar epimerase